MERRVLLAIFLSFLVLYSYQAFFVKPLPKKPADVSTAAGTTAPAAGGQSTTPSSSSPVAPPAPTLSATPAPGTTALVGDSEERDDNAIEAVVSRLRKKLGVDLIETRRGHGYAVEDRTP